MTYTVKRIVKRDDISIKDMDWLINKLEAVNKMYEDEFNGWKNFPLDQYLSRGNLVLFCYKDDNPVGVLAATMTQNLISCKKMLYMDHLSSDQPKATYLLLKEFIDFGRLNAKLIITCIGRKTNIKPGSLEKLGFKELETLFSMEV